MKKEIDFLDIINNPHLDIRLLEIRGFEDLCCQEPTLLLCTDNNSESRNNFFIRSLKTGDFISVSPNKQITLFSEQGTSFIEVTFHEEEDFYLDPRLTAKPEKEKLIRMSIYAILRNNLKGCPHSEVINTAYINQLISLVTDNTGLVSHTKRRKHDMFRDILLFISHSQAGSLTMNEVSNQYGYTPQYFSAFFKENMGLNFQQFYDAVRVNFSLHDLIQGEESLDDVALKNGFSEYRSYVRAFRNLFGITPNDYRQFGCPFRISAALIEDHHVAEFVSSICQYTTLDSDASISTFEKKKIIKTDYGLKGTSIKPLYLSMVRIDDITELLQYNLKEELKTAAKDIGFRLVILPDIFSRHLPFSINVKKQYFFPLQDKIIDYVLSANLRPFIILTEPEDFLGDWQDLVQQFMDHLLKRYSYESVLPWVFCYSPRNEVTWDDTTLLHYRQTYSIIKSISQAILFGSPEFYLLEHTMNSEMKFFDNIQNTDFQPNFISLKYYCGETETDNKNSHVQFSQENFRKYLDRIKALPQIKDRLLFFTALDFTCQDNDYLNDTLYSSTFLLKNILENMDYAEVFAKSSLFDFNSNPMLGINTFHGGRGLLTNNGIRKANYYAYRFLSRLDSNIIARGDGYFITKGYNRITIILYHPTYFTEDYIQNGYRSIPEDNRYSAFQDPVNNRFIITIHGLGKYTESRIKTSTINRKAGSSYDSFHDNGNLEVKTIESLEAIKSLTIPNFTLTEKEIEDGELVLRENVESLEAKLVEIILK